MNAQNFNIEILRFKNEKKHNLKFPEITKTSPIYTKNFNFQVKSDLIFVKFQWKT